MSSTASAIGTAAPQTRASHQKLVRGTRSMHIQPRTKTYRAETPRRLRSCFRLPCSVCPRASFLRCSIQVTSLFRTGPLSLGVAARPSLVRWSAPTISLRCTCPDDQLFHNLIIHLLIGIWEVSSESSDRQDELVATLDRKNPDSFAPAVAKAYADLLPKGPIRRPTCAWSSAPARWT
jgi:hypothetical protein